ncbi:GNAT family N-acetyltransferase [Halopiger djelfimassiliensis]|uniref:GNAT family N-acetyltransferase n=1 Tax=Halopiger djelfimassiliensis TaxID=1293047 RepID=UPI0006778753|nr:GNAT family N-acetyltransferase [Halopiger djelfimassiliensis]
MAVYVHTASADDALDVRRILDAAMLEPGNVEQRIAEGDVFVAGDRRAGTDATDSPSGTSTASDTAPIVESAPPERNLGALVLEPHEEPGAHVSAIGVRRRHRDRGIGRALIERALEREGRLTARFDDGVRPFYERLGFSIDPIDERRHRGVAVARERA